MQPGKFHLRITLPILFSLMALIVTACGGSAQTTANTASKAPDNQQILITPITQVSDLTTFDPALATDSSAIDPINMVFSGLVQLDDKLQVHDQLAQSHSVSEDGLTWTFKLKPNLKFSDGAPLTSADVAYSIDRALKPELKSTVSTLYLGLIQGAEERNEGKLKSLINYSLLTPDPQTIIIKTSKRAAYFLQELTYQTSYVVEKSMIDKYGDYFADHLSEGIGGDGPWKVEKYTHGKEVIFVPNPNFEGPKPQLKKVIMQIYKASDTTYKAYQTNNLDKALVPSIQLANAKKLPNGQLHHLPRLQVYFYGMNELAKPFDNLKIRQAFALAIDKESIVHNVYKDLYIATNHIIPEGMPGYNPALTGPAGHSSTKADPELAKKLFQEGMQEAGYTPATFPSITFTVSTGGSGDTRDEYAAAQQMWQSTLGVSVKIQDIDFSTLLDNRTNTLHNPKGMQIWGLSWGADYPDPQNWLTLLFSKDSAKNAYNYGQNNTPQNAQQEQMQKLMAQADGNPDQAARLKQYNEAEQALVNDVVWIPIYQDALAYVYKPCIVGIADNALDVIPQNDWGSIYKTTATPCANVSHYQ
ncbi:peptide ABC transporter substrate-binding protein [Ktedonosporobacter rubrisoli]|uniref:Peptide ABC transporter substrate-binding protein n=1 Tax=Ktedonosporobacter rubrisoli TaxID=2509675 RepID=A0A4P6JW75_KTERU|nr:peptide ABC transporter substrate-binding protein [Ktedonosporobacter rubrisoli]QBD79938.1 peptide ABC transporter substrate-binding protein [Ktedonosporobacter rubrisoli]